MSDEFEFVPKPPKPTIGDDELDSSAVAEELVAREGDIPLLAEELTKKHGKKVLERHVIAAVVGNQTAAKSVIDRFRMLSVLKMYAIISSAANETHAKLDSLTGAEVAKVYASLMSTFNQLTMPQVKDGFDFDEELNKLIELYPEENPDELAKELRRYVPKK